ncbi:MAG: CvpA family protein [Dehalococcoidia bacterium]|nr:CvpA family protein [Dehalococcoidia bacterium]
MNWVDALIVVILAIAAYLGWRAGFIGGIIHLIGFVLANPLAIIFGPQLGRLFLGQSAIASLVGGAVVFALVILVASLVARLVRDVLKIILLAWIDSLAGAAFRAAIAALILGLVLLVLRAVPQTPAPLRQNIEQSRLLSAAVTFVGSRLP